MASPTLRQQLAAELDRYGPLITNAFRDSIAEIKSKIVLQDIVNKLQANDIDGAIAAMHLEPAAFTPLEQAVAQAFLTGGTVTSNSFPKLIGSDGGRILVRFNVRNPVAEAYIKDHSSQLITNVLADQKAAARSALVDGLAAGRNPTNTALDIVGRVNRATGQREGGILGLSTPQAQYVSNARAELLSGDPAKLQNYLTRERRDKRFDATVIKAMKDGKPLAADDVTRITGRYADGLLKLRGDTIGLHETRTAMEASKFEAYRQANESGKINGAVVTKVWRHYPSPHPRIWHEEMNGKTIPLAQPFILPDGAQMMFAHDPNASVKETLGCYCQTDYKFDYFAGVR